MNETTLKVVRENLIDIRNEASMSIVGTKDEFFRAQKTIRELAITSVERLDHSSILKLSQYEQSALAELASAAKSIQWQVFGLKQLPTAAQLENFADIVERFDRIKWDNLYDKLHRTGANFY